MSRRLGAAVLVAAALAGACDRGAPPPPRLGTTFEVTSRAFARGEEVPPAYTCEGQDVSPPLEWSGAPEDTVSYAVVVSDPDAPDGTFIHWVAWGIDREATSLAQGEPPPAEGENGFGETGYRGPCPPPGDQPHRYRFTVYALAVQPDLEDGAGWSGLLAVIDDHALAEGTLEARFGR